MSSQTKYHGDLNPVANFDQRAYTVGALNDVTSAATVQPQGPKLDFFTVTFSGHKTGTEVAAAISAIQQLAVVYIYEFTTGGSNDTLAFACYPTGAWTTGALDTATGGTTTATATFTN